MTRTTIPIAQAAAHLDTRTATPNEPNPGLSSLPPLSLYVHYPWCVRKCPYCDFNSHQALDQEALPEAAYLAALIRDLESALPQIWGRRIVSVFIGGGTPSLLSAAGLNQLLADLRARLPLLANAEITLEANPGTVEADKFAAFREAGINRLSLGIQSFNDRHLTALGRIHSGAEARQAIELAQRHFDNINLDLMYALPRQTLAEAEQDLRTAISHGSTHLSAYHLTLEPNTAFHHQPPPLPDDDLAADMQEMVDSTLTRAGFEHYETSAYARDQHRCQHNLNYWTYGDYLGIGAGAHSKISSADGILREVRRRHPRDYLAAASAATAAQTGPLSPFLQSRQAVPARERPFEFMMNALRLNAGFNPKLFETHTGLPLASITDPLLTASRRGLLTVSHERIAPTEQGQRFLNDLLEIFLPAAA
ncbi:MAG: radical SAM family heme chaperone HemW [Sterolibacterium sp.]|nr:radical SAM family heme chaperone HemW [Sterolibacterium sp.]